MSRPEVSLDNLDFYDFYRDHVQNQAFARFAHLAMARIYRLDITTDEGLEESIHEELEAGSRLLLSPNHLTDHDQNVVVSLVQRYKPLNDLRGNTFIPAKESLFTQPGIKGGALRWAVDELGAVPTTRAKDLGENGDQVDERYHLAIDRASDVQVAKLVKGENMAAYWESTRNRKNFSVVQPLKKGVGYTAINATERGVRVVMLPIGVYYGGEPDDYDAKKPNVPEQFKPTIHLGSLIPVETDKASELTALLHPAIQKCVDIVVARTFA